MKLKITKNIEEANLITHSSTFHPDDVFSTMFLSKIIENPIVCRTNNPDLAPRDAIVYDIGFGKFDHHGTDARIRSNSSLKYCSFGLRWEEYGKVFVNSGSISLPKDNTDHSYLIIDNNEIILKNVDGDIIENRELI